MVNAKSHASVQIVASAQEEGRVQTERGRVDYQCVEWSLKGLRQLHALAVAAHNTFR